jgi:hypothetical protein
MTSETGMPALVFKDGDGDYFLVPQELLVRGRVPGERAEQIERLLAGADADVSGHMVASAYTLLGVVNQAAIAIGTAVEDAVRHERVWGNIYKPQ